MVLVERCRRRKFFWRSSIHLGNSSQDRKSLLLGKRQDILSQENIYGLSLKEVEVELFVGFFFWRFLQRRRRQRWQLHRRWYVMIYWELIPWEWSKFPQFLSTELFPLVHMCSDMTLINEREGRPKKLDKVNQGGVLENLSKNVWLCVNVKF